MKKFLIACFSVLFLLIEASLAYGYPCPSGYYCNTNGGTGTTGWYGRRCIKYGLDPKTRKYGCLDYVCSYGAVPYGCSGDASSCNGGGATIYGSLSDCIDGSGGSEDSWYCCDKIPCTAGVGCIDCTPDACPEGYSDVNPNNYCSTQYRNDTSCSKGTDECGSPCGSNTRACYLIETNTTFMQADLSTNGPSSVSIIVDGTTFSLSSDPNNPTPIKLPASGSSNVQVTTPTFTAPTTSRGANYSYQVNNYGNNDEWKTWATCSGVAGEDFCTTMPNSNNTQSFVPTSKTVNQVLKEGAKGQVSVKYATTDKCTDTYQYSVALEGYYIVDDIPEPPEPPDDDDDGSIFDLTTDSTSSKGCTSTTYTGQEVNNPLHVTAASNDENGNDEIQAFTLWFSKDNTVPTTGTITGTYSGSSNQDLGIMIRKNGSSWTNPYIYATNTSPFTFARITNGYITVNGSNIARIYDVSVTQGTSVVFDYKIEFLASVENLSGMYNVYGGVLDTYMINGTSLDQSYFTSLTDWGIDLVNPVANDITQEVRDATNTYITWSVADTISGVNRTVINAYRVGGVVTDNVTLYLPAAYTTSKGSVTLTSNSNVPDSEQIGTYNDTNAWVFSSNTGETDVLNIGGNESGNIILYTSPYDMACNTDSGSENIDLNPWFATRGGSVYSVGNISSTSKDVSSNTDLDGVFNTKTQMTKERIDLGTELLATRNTNITNLVHNASGATRALEVSDNNEQGSYWYTLLYRKFEKQTDELTVFNRKASDDATTDSCAGSNCYMYSTEDISIPSGYACNVPTLFISEKDIYIEPNTESGSGLSGCIFLAKNNIYVGAGKYLSNTKINYDYLEGFFIADNQIVFSLVDQTRVLRDGIEVYGGLVAMGSNITDGSSAISIQRNMRLFNQTNPTLVVTYDNRYANLSYIFFGTSVQLYKQEVGFKTSD